MKTFTQFLLEMKSQHIKKIGQALNRFKQADTTRLPMGNIFHDKSRIAISPNGADNNIIRKFLDQLREMGYQPSLDDLQSGQITKIIKTNQGDKQRKLSIGKILHPNQLDLWSQVKNNLSLIKNFDQDYSIIISRHPLDVLRMSDHIDPDGYKIQSCHSQGNSYFHCAKEEARTGGAVAYAVRTKDLLNVKNLQAPEIFADQERNIKGIYPLERIRLRRFTSGQQDELLIPEIRTYPAKTTNYDSRSVPGFRAAVKKWATEVQTLPKDPKEAFKQFSLRGGSYQDNEAGYIWSDFFNINVQGVKYSLDQGDGPGGKHINTAEHWEQEARNMTRQHYAQWGNEWHHLIDIHYEADDGYGEHDAWGNWHAIVLVSFPLHQFNNLPSSFPKTETNELVNHLIYNHKRENVDDVKIEKENDKLVVEIKFTKDHQQVGELDEYEHFLDELDGVVEDWELFQNEIERWFMEKRWMPNQILDTHEKYNWQWFTIEAPKQYSAGNDHDYSIYSNYGLLGDLTGLPPDHNVVSTSGAHLELPWDDIFYHHKLFPPIPGFVGLPGRFRHSNQNVFFLDRNYTNHDMKERSITQKSVQNIPFTSNDQVTFHFRFYLTHDMPLPEKKKILAGAQHLDKNFKSYEMKLQDWFNKVKALVASSPQYPRRDKDQQERNAYKRTTAHVLNARKQPDDIIPKKEEPTS